ncbi:MAG: hypothetical protein ACOX6S_00910 [Clostridia bacterium]
MHNFKIIGRVFQATMGKWVMAPKAIITALLLTVFCLVLATPLYEYAVEEGKSLNVLEPYLCLLQSSSGDAGFCGLLYYFVLRRSFL